MSSKPHPPERNRFRNLLTIQFIPNWIILPMRFFLAYSFIAAGIDKLTDPSYLDPSAHDYIGQQISRFAPGTPIEGFLLHVAVPNATLFGVMVMGGELCIGLAVLLGLFTRFSAVMGLLLNLTFFLSATWDIQPFYFGADLPYMFCWLTLALAGPGPLALDSLVKLLLYPAPPRAALQPTRASAQSASVHRKSAGSNSARTSSSSSLPPTVRSLPPSSVTQPADNIYTRRAVLAGGATGLVAMAMAAVGLGWGILHPRSGNASVNVANNPSSSPTPGTFPKPTIPPVAPTATQAPAATTVPEAPASPLSPTEPQAPSPTPQPPADTPTPEPATSGLTQLLQPGQLPIGQAGQFTLPTGEPALIVHNDAGYSAYVAICTHEGCEVIPTSSTMLSCPCHGARFDATTGEVLRGPARRPLSSIALVVGSDGSVYLGS